MQINNIVIAPATCGHLVVTATVGGQVRTVHIHRDEFDLDPDEVRAAFVARLRSFARENGYTTMAQLRTNVVGKTFHL